MKYLLLILLSFTQAKHKHKFTIVDDNCKCYVPMWCSVPKCKAMWYPFKHYGPNPYKILYPGDSLYRAYNPADTFHIK